MNYFWSNVIDNAKERRLAAVFFGTLMALGGLLIAGFIIYQIVCAYGLQKYFVYSLPGIALVLLVWMGRGVVQLRARRRARQKTSPLSRDELGKARSKLMKNQKQGSL